jgi:hypothetical protein
MGFGQFYDFTQAGVMARNCKTFGAKLQAYWRIDKAK